MTEWQKLKLFLKTPLMWVFYASAFLLATVAILGLMAGSAGKGLAVRAGESCAKIGGDAQACALVCAREAQEHECANAYLKASK